MDGCPVRLSDGVGVGIWHVAMKRLAEDVQSFYLRRLFFGVVPVPGTTPVGGEDDEPTTA